MDRRIYRHPILQPDKSADQDMVTIEVDGENLSAREGEPIAAALAAHGLRVLRRTEILGQPRGVFCGIGQCTDCAMTVDGVPNVRTCVTPVRAGMKIRTQSGLGSWKESN